VELSLMLCGKNQLALTLSIPDNALRPFEVGRLALTDLGANLIECLVFISNMGCHDHIDYT
jgi:hypothetical protein